MPFSLLSPNAGRARVTYCLCDRLPAGHQTVALPSAGQPFSCPRLSICGAACRFCPVPPVPQKKALRPLGHVRLSLRLLATLAELVDGCCEAPPEAAGGPGAWVVHHN